MAPLVEIEILTPNLRGNSETEARRGSQGCPSTTIWLYMRSQDEDVEDDFAAEEENKLINEVCAFILLSQRSLTSTRNTRHGPQICRD